MEENSSERRALVLVIVSAAVLAFTVFDVLAENDDENAATGARISLPAAERRELKTAAPAPFSSDEITNPFTMQHEMRDENETDAPPANETPKTAATPLAFPAAVPTDAEAETVSANETPVLQGTAISDTERLAIISDGNETRTLAVGEDFHGRRITRITDYAVTFDDNSVLRLKD